MSNPGFRLNLASSLFSPSHLPLSVPHHSLHLRLMPGMLPLTQPWLPVERLWSRSKDGYHPMAAYLNPLILFVLPLKFWRVPITDCFFDFSHCTPDTFSVPSLFWNAHLVPHCSSAGRTFHRSLSPLKWLVLRKRHYFSTLDWAME